MKSPEGLLLFTTFSVEAAAESSVELGDRSSLRLNITLVWKWFFFYNLRSCYTVKLVHVKSLTYNFSFLENYKNTRDQQMEIYVSLK